MVVVLAAVGSVASAGCSYRGLVQTTGPRETVAWCCMMDAEEASASTELVVMVDGSASSNQGYVVMPDFTCASLPMASDELDGFIASYASPDFAPRRVNNITADIGRYAREPAGPWAVVVGVHCLEWVSGCKISVMSLDVTANTTLIAADEDGGGKLGMGSTEALFTSIQERVVVICLAHRWSPPALHAARALCGLRSGSSSSVTPYSKIFVVDADDIESQEDVEALGLALSPAVYLFYSGKPLVIRRPGLDEDIKFVGSAPAERWEELIQFARQTGDNGGHVLVWND
ncbi:uncharacterized protein AMSG_12095 [Thecamonas trahens ATCC 50062]|uniref:Thioredoxin domain-containing protein n=1 Tax=Thecamonas trahens ATCC 50062 TaxID=461836 RepID=A0A0L0DK12_THETB|nr:hypothetical protein AMSG_12095 [Thecamonas trahens ATCC 50062]KNC51663.1 hypothetical protein AMSG_12095 [Thecamonas trahens ATCC 50062]|eukprot:XP_013755896.1 hypothetical protein AMSG_12095 [Thecamonas trahens ATCC 50062]